MNTIHISHQTPKGSIQLLDPNHYEVLRRAIRNVLATEIAETTMAQLVDGLPLASTMYGTRGHHLIRGHPLLDHEILCEGALEQTKAFRDEFEPSIIMFDTSTLQAFQNADLDSMDYKLRLVELVAICTHQIAVRLFQLQPKVHVGDIEPVMSWKREAQWVTLEVGRRVFEKDTFEPRPTLFFHPNYLDHDQYPDGLADIAGYWAEDKIFGGVIIFDRGDSGDDSKDLYLHPGRRQTTFRIWKPDESQFEALIGFMWTENPSEPPPFPLFVSDENFQRHDPWDAIALHHIYRDPWERKFPMTRPPDTRDVRSSGDYPESIAILERINAKAAQAESASASSSNLEGFLRLPATVVRDAEEQGRTHETTAEIENTNALYAGSPPRSPISSTSGHDEETNSLYARTPACSPPPRSPVGFVVVGSPQTTLPPSSPLPRSPTPASSPSVEQRAANRNILPSADNDGVTSNRAIQPGPPEVPAVAYAGNSPNNETRPLEWAVTTHQEQAFTTEKRTAGTNKRKAAELEDGIGQEGNMRADARNPSSGDAHDVLSPFRKDESIDEESRKSACRANSAEAA